MAEQAKTYFQGILVPDERICHENLISKTAAAIPSSYTQADPRPGVPAPNAATNMVLEASNTQSEDGHLEILTTRAGHPGIGGRGGFVWRDEDAGDTTSEYKGWEAPSIATAFQTIVGTTSSADEPRLNVIRLQSGKLLAGGITGAATCSTAVLPSYDPTTYAWTSNTATLLGHAGLAVEIEHCLIQLPSGRCVLFVTTVDWLQVDAYYSDDDGANWSIYAAQVLRTPIQDGSADPDDVVTLRAAYSNGQVVLFVEFTKNGGGATNIAQYASDDLGQSFTLVDADMNGTSGDTLTDPAVTAIPGGGFLLAVFRTYTGPAYQVATYSIGSAYSPAANADPVTGLAADSQGLQGLAVWADETNILYIAASRYIGNQVAIGRSVDAGQTWTEFLAGMFSLGSNTVRMKDWDITSTGGRACMVGRFDSAEGEATHSVVAIWLGGFSSHTLPAAIYDDEHKFEDINQTTYCGDTIAARGYTYVPIGQPDVFAWVLTQTGGTSAITSTIDLEIDCTGGAATRYYTLTWVDTSSSTNLIAECAVRVPSGYGDRTANQICFRVRYDNGGEDYDVRISFQNNAGVNGFQVYDINGAAAVGSNVNVDLSTETHVRVVIDDEGKVRTWYCQQAHVREWTAGPTGAVADGGGGAGHVIEFGQTGAAADKSYWTFVGYSGEGLTWSPRSENDNLASTWTALNGVDLWPAPYSTAPQLIFDGVKLRAAAGPTRIGDSWDIVAEYDHGIEHIDPRISPCPRKTWRSNADNQIEDIHWNTEGTFTDETFMDNYSIAIVLKNINFQTCQLDGYTGAAWTTLLSIDASTGYDTLDYVREGSSLFPDVADANQGAKFLFTEDHAGDHVKTDSGGGNTLHRIIHNTGGAWVENQGAVKRPTLMCNQDDFGGAEASSGQLDIWRQDVAMILHGYTGTYSRFRLRIPAQHTVEDYYEIGAVLIGHVELFGRSFDNRWKWRTVHNVELSTMLDGRRRSRQNGPPRRALDFAWVQTALDLTEIRLTDPEPDYVEAVSGGTAYPIATPYDTCRQVEGVIRRLGQAQTPCVVFTAIAQQTSPTVTEALNDRTTWAYGRITNDQTRENVLGREGVSELERLNTVVFEEEE